MEYGVKVIHTHTVGEEEVRFYEELILKVNASSFDEAYEKAERYMADAFCEYTNIDGKRVKTYKIESIDCFMAHDAENGVQQVYSSFKRNFSPLSEDLYYEAITATCDTTDRRPLRSL